MNVLFPILKSSSYIYLRLHPSHMQIELIIFYTVYENDIGISLSLNLRDACGKLTNNFSECTPENKKIVTRSTNYHVRMLSACFKGSCIMIMR